MHDRDLDRLLPHLADGNGDPLPEDRLDELMERVQQGNDVPLWLKFRDGRVRIEAIASREVPRRFGFVARPDAARGRRSVPMNRRCAACPLIN